MMRLRVQKGRQCSPIVLESAWRGKSLPGIFWRATPRCVGLRFVAVSLNENAPRVGSSRGGVLVGTVAWCRWSRLQAVHGMGAVGSSKCGLDAMFQDIGHGVAGQRQTVADGAGVPRQGDKRSTPKAAASPSCSDRRVKRVKVAPRPLDPGELLCRLEDGQTALSERLERQAERKRLSLGVAQWAIEDNGFYAEDGRKQAGCGTWLLFRQALAGDFAGRAFLRGANFCQMRLTCCGCAAVECSRFVRGYVPKLLHVLGQRPDLRVWLATLTIRTGPDLAKQERIMRDCRRRLAQLFRNFKRRGTRDGFGAVEGWFFATEVKRQPDGNFHVHVHSILLAPPDWRWGPARQQWVDLCQGQSDYVWFGMLEEHEKFEAGTISAEDVQLGVAGALVEVMKYPFKFEHSDPQTIWYVSRVLKGKRLRAAGGLLRGVKLPEDVDESRGIDWELVPWVEVVARFNGSGFSIFGGVQDVQG